MSDTVTSNSARQLASARSLQPDLGDPRNRGIMSVI
jgi:hypothetical protein